MFIKKNKTLVYITLFSLILSFIIPIYSFASDEDNIYVWSNNSSSVSTSISPSTNEQEGVNNTSTEKSRKFFRYYFWLCNTYGAN